LGDAIDAFHAALRLWEQREHDRAAAIVVEVSSTHVWMMDTAAAEQESSRGLAVLGALSMPSRAMLYYSRALSRFTGGNLRGAAEDFADGDALRVPDADPRLDAFALSSLSNFEYAQMQPERSLGLAQQAGAAFAARGDLWRQANITWTIPLNLLFLGRVKEGVQALDELQQIADRIGHQAARWIIHGTRAFLHVAMGDVSGGMKAAEHALEIARAAGIPWAYHTEAFIGSMALRIGREAEGLAALRRAAQVERERPNYWRPSMDAVLFNALATCSPDDARAWYQSSKIELQIDGNMGGGGSWCAVGFLIEAYARLDYRDEVMALAPHVTELQARGISQAGGWAAPVDVLSGIVSTAMEQWDKAESEFLVAIKELDAAPNHFQTGPVREWYAEMLFARARLGDRERAIALIDEAIEIYRSLGFKGLEHQALRRRSLP